MTDTFSKTLGAHLLKIGGSAERSYCFGCLGASTFNGSFSFATDANNPYNSGYAYANAILGVFDSYTESTNRIGVTTLDKAMEWFVQDSWKVNRRLTLELGLRFYWIQPRVTRYGLLSGFVPGRYDPAQAVQLIGPAMVAGKRVALDPITKTAYPVAAIGAISLNSGNPADGLVVPAQTKDYPASLMDSPGVQPAPRFGFAWDPFGNGKMANMSFSIQRDVGFDTVVDVAYVGTLGRHLLWGRNINAIPMGAQFVQQNPKNADPTNPTVALPTQFLRPIIGYGDINYYQWGASSNYHSLQVTANRRFRRGLQFGASWTWSKTMDFVDTDTASIPPFVSPRWNYGMASFDHTHILKANWLWNVPKFPWNAGPARWVVNGWQVSGIATFMSGAPLGIGYTLVTAANITGTPSLSARVVVTASPILPKSERTFSHNFRTGVFLPPAVGTLGNAAKTEIRGPGLNNWNLTAIKGFPIRERVHGQFRCEFYNAFNHTQFTALNTTAQFNAAGNQVNAALSQFTAAASARVIQFAVRLQF